MNWEMGPFQPITDTIPKILCIISIGVQCFYIKWLSQPSVVFSAGFCVLRVSDLNTDLKNFTLCHSRRLQMAIPFTSNPAVKEEAWESPLQTEKSQPLFMNANTILKERRVSSQPLSHSMFKLPRELLREKCYSHLSNKKTKAQSMTCPRPHGVQLSATH